MASDGEACRPTGNLGPIEGFDGTFESSAEWK
jgi:hypothetical protein